MQDINEWISYGLVVRGNPKTIKELQKWIKTQSDKDNLFFVKDEKSYERNIWIIKKTTPSSNSYP